MIEILAICTFILFVIMYKLISLRYFIHLQEKLKNGNLAEFKKTLGTNFQYKPRINGLIRYKWSKSWITIRADFDEEGILNYTDMDERKFTILPEYTLSLTSE